MSYPVFFSRLIAAERAKQAGLRSFRTFRPLEGDKSCWTFKGMNENAITEYCELYCDGKDWIHHFELSNESKPVLVVTCFKSELPSDIPDLFVIEPATPELWAKEPDYATKMSAKLRSATPVVSGVVSGRWSSADAQPNLKPVTQQVKRPTPVATGGDAPGRAVGAVALCRQFFHEVGGADRAKYKQLCEAAGINKSTMGVQWGKNLKASQN